MKTKRTIALPWTGYDLRKGEKFKLKIPALPETPPSNNKIAEALYSFYEEDGLNFVSNNGERMMAGKGPLSDEVFAGWLVSEGLIQYSHMHRWSWCVTDLYYKITPKGEAWLKHHRAALRTVLAPRIQEVQQKLARLEQVCA